MVFLQLADNSSTQLLAVDELDSVLIVVTAGCAKISTEIYTCTHGSFQIPLAADAEAMSR